MAEHDSALFDSKQVYLTTLKRTQLHSNILERTWFSSIILDPMQIVGMAL